MWILFGLYSVVRSREAEDGMYQLREKKASQAPELGMRR